MYWHHVSHLEPTIHNIEKKGRNYRVRLSFPNGSKSMVVSSVSFIELVNSINGKYYLDKELNSSLSKIKVSKYKI